MTIVQEVRAAEPARARKPEKVPGVPGQIVLVLQGGGALGAYQAGVYQALHEAGIEPDWVIGTSIGAINAGIIAGNEVRDRLPRLREFWRRVERRELLHGLSPWRDLANALANLATLFGGIPGFFELNPLAFWGSHVHLGPRKPDIIRRLHSKRRSPSSSTAHCSTDAGRGSRSEPPTCAPAKCIISTRETPR
jgi:Patatin-like phospholipase